MSLGEFELIQRYFVRKPDDWPGHPQLGHSQVCLGIGDDAALLELPPGERLVVTTDTLVAGRHFPHDAAAVDIGWKALAVNLSDLAAMAARPLGVTLNLTMPEANESWLAAFARGFWGLADIADVPLIGGDTTRGPLSVTITAIGCVEESVALKRGGAQAGDLICVTGSLGDAGAGLALAMSSAEMAGISDDDRAYLLDRLHRPMPRLLEGAYLRGIASAGLDISDGLLQDLGHLLKASNVGAELAVEQLPLSEPLQAYAATSSAALLQVRRWALSAGDDYELLFTLAPARARLLPQLRYTVIGKITPTAGLRLTAHGKPWEHDSLAGYQHF
ncbi:thiamine-phosphate kinase [Paraperlucidibaca baekdonensis]|uniref:Thiamine-monophosphate kinase n=1 Tax=Paraperlucidibaca baekdonensis TaxID=748120 RepID=A0A3E0H827_9GAMM|nr:thiamine-phosphate kinase [Paraperlucidibaca baekdonensis]REH39898.1 thiamine-phosphate kinase [Paraperlucidibaca baekdonensis]